MTMFNKRKQECILLTKEVKDLKQRVDTLEKQQIDLLKNNEGLLDLITLLTDKIWKRNDDTIKTKDMGKEN